MIRQGDRLADSPLATVACGQLVEIPLGDLLAGRTVAIVGLPGAFTPVCTGHHLPLLIHSKARLAAAGIDRILCVAPDNPWAMAAWRANLPGAEDFHFLSDANHHLIRALGMATRVESLHLGTTSRRWLVIARDGVVQRHRVEASVLDVTCTGPDAAVAMMDEIATAPTPGPELALVG